MKCSKCGIETHNMMEENIHEEWHRWQDKSK